MVNIFHYMGGESYEILTPHFDITPHTNYVEFFTKNYYYYYEFNNDHTIREKTKINLTNI